MINYDDINNSDNGRSEKITNALDQVSGNTGVGFLSSALSDTLRGLNHMQTPNSVPINRDYHGLTLFTRPILNMSDENLRHYRRFSPLLNSDATTLPRAIRALLDTDCKLPDNGWTSPLVDEYNAFIPILTNQLISCSGWPDEILPTYTSPSGLYQEEWSIGDGVVEVNRAFNLQANFRNITGDPITALFMVWINYISMVRQGIMVPYPKFIIEREIDYQTRIYRLVLDHSRTYVQKIAACAAAFPVSDPLGNAFNFESDKPINQGNDQISVEFRCMRAMYNDPILIDEFNRTSILHNTNLGGTDRDREQYFVKLTPQLQTIFNHRGYPMIDERNYRLNWWVTKEEYQDLVERFLPTEDDDE